MTEIISIKKSSLHLLRPHSATQFQNGKYSLRFDDQKIRPASANPNPSDENLRSQTFLTAENLYLSDENSTNESQKPNPNPSIENVVDLAHHRTKKKKKKKIIQNPKTTIKAWQEKKKLNKDEIHPYVNVSLHGLDDSDEYDTDIEEDFIITENRHPIDPTGLYCYERKCKESGLIPVSHITRNIGSRNMRMRHHYLGGDATKPIADALKVNTVTENVDLSDNYLESKGAYYIADMMQENLFIVNLNLSNNFISTSGVEALSNMLQNNTTLKTLSLSGNRMSDRDAMLLVEGLKNNETLQSLDLSNNNFGELGGIYLGNVLATNESIYDIDLSWNCIRRKGATSIVQALKTNVVLEVLDLSWNGIGLEGATALQKYLPLNQKLQILDLTNNRITTESAKKLAVGLKKNKVLETINLNQNAMKDEGVDAILKAVRVNLVLKLVCLENCAEIGLSASNYNLIQEICEDRDITILHGGTGGYKRPTAITSTLNIFSVFLENHRSNLQSAFIHQDRENLGILNVDEVKNCLRDTGLRLTNRQLDMLLETVDRSNTGNINYSEILSVNVISDQFRRKTSHCSSPGQTENRNIKTVMQKMQRQATV